MLRGRKGCTLLVLEQKHSGRGCGGQGSQVEGWWVQAGVRGSPGWQSGASLSLYLKVSQPGGRG